MLPGQRVRDEWLALRCQAAEPGAFEALLSELERPLFAYLRHLVRQQDFAVDLLQETWIRALSSFGRLKDPSAVRTWFYTLAHGIAVDHLRREQVRHRAEERYAVEEETDAAPDLSALTAAEVREALLQLSAEHRAVLVLHFLEDFSIAEVAGVVGCPPGTVKSRLHHAKAQLKHILLEKGYGTQSTLPS